MSKSRSQLLLNIWNQDAISKRPAWTKLILPVFLMLPATWITLHPFESVALKAPFLFFFGVIFLSACYGGSLSALTALLSGTIFSLLFILPLHKNDYSDFLLLIAAFFTEGMLLSGLFSLIESFQKKLKSSEERFRGIVEQSDEGFLMADEKGIIIYSSPSVKQLLGYTETEITGMPLISLVYKDDQKSFDFRFLKLLAHHGEASMFLQRLKTKDDQWIWIEGSVSNMLKDPRIKSLIFHYRNVNDRMDKAKQQEDFVHMASHELKTPITSLKGFLQIIKLQHFKEQRQKDNQLISRMENQLDRLLNLIEDMLNVTRIKAGELQYHFSYLDFNECVRAATNALQASTTSHQLVLTTTDSPAIYGDKDRLTQVICNLVNNAIKYSPGSTTVNVVTELQETEVVLKVKDHGIGIPKDQQKKVFDRFYRVNTLPKNTFEGLGLGLYISKEIVKKHGGKMGVESSEGQGSTFWFTLPLNKQ